MIDCPRLLDAQRSSHWASRRFKEQIKLKKQVAALTAGLQKVSAQLELRKSAPQTVVNSQ